MFDIYNSTPYKLISDDGYRLLYEGGYWMYKNDSNLHLKEPNRFGIDVNQDTKQLSIYFMPRSIRENY